MCVSAYVHCKTLVGAVGDGKLNEGLLLACVADFEGPTRHGCCEGERTLQPVVHSALACAALSASVETGRDFLLKLSPGLSLRRRINLQMKLCLQNLLGD